MDAHGVSQNEVARRASVSRSHVSEIIAGKATPSAKVLHRLHGVLYRRSSKEERVMPVDVQVLAWRKGARSGVVAPGGLISAVWRRRLAAAGVCGGHWHNVHSPPLNARYGHPRARAIAGLGSIGGLTSLQLCRQETSPAASGSEGMGEEEICCRDCGQSSPPNNWPRHRNSLRHRRQILRPRPWGWGRERGQATERFWPGRRGAGGCTDART